MSLRGIDLAEFNYALPTHSISSNPKFIVISPSIEEKPLTSFRVFLLKKAIDNISTAYEYITQLRDGNLLILVKSIPIQKDSLQSLPNLGISSHESQLI